MWARALIDGSTKDATKKAISNMEIASDLLESDPKRSREFAEQSSQIEITPLLVSYLIRLKQANKDDADQLFLRTIAYYSQRPDVDANQFAYLGAYLFKSPNMGAFDPGWTSTRVGDIGMPDFTSNRPGVSAQLIQPYLRGALFMIYRPSNDVRQRTVKYALGYLLLPKAREFVPSMVSEFLAALASIAAYVPPQYTNDAAYGYMGAQPGSPKDRIGEIEKIADSYTRDQLFLDLVFHAFRKSDFKSARLANSRIEDKSLRDQLDTLIHFGETMFFLKGKTVNLDEMAQRIAKIPEGLEKCLSWLGSAALAYKMKKRAIHTDMLGAARSTCTRMTNELAPYLLMYLSGRLKSDRDSQAGAVLAESIATFNKFPEIKEPSPERTITLEPLSLRFPLAVPDVNVDFQTSFSEAVKGEEEDAIVMVNDIKDERLKGLAYVALTKAIVTKKTLESNYQDKVVRVGEDGLRKAAIKAVMPGYPPTSVKSKAAGVAVAEVQFDGEGTVTSVKVLESPDSAIGQVVTQTMKQWKFKPSQLDGNPISVRGKITFYFSITPKGKGEVKNPKQYQ